VNDAIRVGAAAEHDAVDIVTAVSPSGNAFV
jgi:hypothetical protein